MKSAIFVYNGFLYPDEPPKTFFLLKKSAQKLSIDLVPMTNAALILAEEKKIPDEISFILFWDKDTVLCRILESFGVPVYNSSKSIELCDDKALTYLALKGKVPMPKTVAAPATFPNIGYKNRDFLSEISDTLGFPLVIKERKGSWGEQVYLARDYSELDKIVLEHQSAPLLLQNYVITTPSGGLDKRLYAVGDCVVASAIRQNPSDFRANYHTGSSMSPYSPSEAETKMALTAARVLGLDFCGVDIVTDENGQSYVLEVNSNAEFTGLTQSTGVDIAGKILSWSILRRK